MTYQEIAQLIREGAKRRPQCRGGMFRIELYQSGTRSCALGALYEARFGETHHRDPRTSPLEGLLKEFPLLKRSVSLFLVPDDLRAHRRANCRDDPTVNLDGWSVADHIMALNDHLSWSREAIADWVETLDHPQPMEVEADEALVPA